MIRLYDEVRDTLGPIDILVLNATPDQPQRPIEEYDWAFFQQMLDFFVKSPYLLTRACLPHMKAQKFGRIINITSEVFDVGVSPFTAYVAAKGAQTGFTRSLARELAPCGITVNNVAPGWIPVERHEKDPQSDKDAYLARRAGRPLGAAAGCRRGRGLFRQPGGRVRHRSDRFGQRRPDGALAEWRTRVW